MRKKPKKGYKMISSLGTNIGFGANSGIKTPEARKEQELSTTNVDKNSKVAQIAAAIADGSYEIDISKTAKAVADAIA